MQQGCSAVYIIIIIVIVIIIIIIIIQVLQHCRGHTRTKYWQPKKKKTDLEEKAVRNRNYKDRWCAKCMNQSDG